MIGVARVEHRRIRAHGDAALIWSRCVEKVKLVPCEPINTQILGKPENMIERSVLLHEDDDMFDPTNETIERRGGRNNNLQKGKCP